MGAAFGWRARSSRRLQAVGFDYGCGDGTFLALVHDLFPQALGVDVANDQLADCAVRFAGAPGITFLPTNRLGEPRHRDRYEVVVCMEVLEHCPDDVQVTVLDQIAEVTAPGGTVVISTPIKIGPTLVAKQGARALVALGGLREYESRERYHASEFLRMVMGGPITAIRRDEYEGDGGSRFTGHKGFNWRRLQRTIERSFKVERRLFSPLPLLGAWLNSQVWFVCRKLAIP